MDDQLDGGRMTGERLVDGVVDHLVDQVVQPLGAGAADVHVRALAHRLEALEDLDAVGRVFAACGRAVGGAARLRGPLLTSCFQPSTSEFGGSWEPLERARRRREGRLGSITRDRAASRRTDACKGLKIKRFYGDSDRSIRPCRTAWKTAGAACGPVPAAAATRWGSVVVSTTWPCNSPRYLMR